MNSIQLQQKVSSFLHVSYNVRRNVDRKINSGCSLKLTRVVVPHKRSDSFICKAVDDQSDTEIDELFKEDLARFSKKPIPTEQQQFKAQESEGEYSDGGFQGIIDKVLIADFFFILFALAWLTAGVGLKTFSQSEGLLNAWYALWPVVFQPALGVLMLGALVSGIFGKKQESS